VAIYKLIANGAFAQQEIELMSAAYESAFLTSFHPMSLALLPLVHFGSPSASALGRHRASSFSFNQET
jgi:hypothetical protein